MHVHAPWYLFRNLREAQRFPPYRLSLAFGRFSLQLSLLEYSLHGFGFSRLGFGGAFGRITFPGSLPVPGLGRPTFPVVTSPG